MKIYIIGPTGMLGHVVWRTLEPYYELVGIRSQDYNFCLKSDIDKLCQQLTGTEVVVNCCGLLRQRLPKVPSVQDMLDAFMVNAILPQSLANHCRLIHISTDCVFSGTKGSYTETDLPDSEDLYGRSKALGDSPKGMVLRTSIIGKEINRELGLYAWFQRQSQANGFTNHLWNGVTTNQLAKIIHQILKNEMYQPGLWHVYTNTVSKYQMLIEFNKYRSTPIPIVATNAPVSVDRTLQTLYPDFLKAFLIPSFQEQVKEMELS